MDEFRDLFLIEALLIFGISFIALNMAFGRIPVSKVGERGNPFSLISWKAEIYIILAAAAVTYVFYGISRNVLTAGIVFAAAVGIAPLIISNDRKRTSQEKIFNDVILYCQNMGMMLKQTKGVYPSLEKVSNDLDGNMKDDVRGLMDAFGEDRETVLAAMKAMERNYPYSCIRNLDAILMHMFYENADVDESLLETYQDDVTALEQDVRKNRMKRKTLRISYMIITIGSVLTYWAFTESLRGSFGQIFETSAYEYVLLFYIFGTLLSFFAVDRYFNLNTTKE